MKEVSEYLTFHMEHWKPLLRAWSSYETYPHIYKQSYFLPDALIANAGIFHMACNTQDRNYVNLH